MGKKYLVGLAIGFLMFGMVGMANANLIQNGSFELGSFSGGSHSQPLAMEISTGSTAIANWSITGSSLAWEKTGAFSLTPSDGDFMLDLTGWSDQSPYGGVYQTINTTMGSTYTLSIDLAAYHLDAPVSVLVNAGSTSQSFNWVGNKNEWHSFSFNFIADSPNTLINIAGTGSGTRAFFIGLDNVSVEGVTNAPIPEPATMMLFGLGLIGVAGVSRRKK